MTPLCLFCASLLFRLFTGFHAKSAAARKSSRRGLLAIPARAGTAASCSRVSGLAAQRHPDLSIGTHKKHAMAVFCAFVYFRLFLFLSLFLSKTRYVAVHVRRADYASTPQREEFHGMLSADYYSTAWNSLTVGPSVPLPAPSCVNPTCASGTRRC